MFINIKRITLSILVLLIFGCVTHEKLSKNVNTKDDEICIVSEQGYIKTACYSDSIVNGCVFPLASVFPMDSLGKRGIDERIRSVELEYEKILIVESIVDSIITRTGSIAFRCINADTVIKIDHENLRKYKRQYLAFTDNGDTIINVTGIFEKPDCQFWKENYYKGQIGTGYTMESWHCRINLTNKQDSECYMN